MRATPQSIFHRLGNAWCRRAQSSSCGSRRAFSTTPYLYLRTTELVGSTLTRIKADADRLWDTIHSTARWTEPKSSTSERDVEAEEDIRTAGLTRLTLSEEDKQARDWFVQTTESLGCKVQVDQIGNIFAIRPGLNEADAVPATFVGSHLDSQPSGGRFDGVLGVAAGVEMLRVLNDNWIETEGPVGVVNWTNEEGAKYPISMMGSGVWAGRVPLQDAWNAKSVYAHSTMVKQELERNGYLGSVPAGRDGVQLGAHFELHLEQGPKLETERQAIGVVEGVQAYKWFTITIRGRESHAGTTDFANRADALYAAATFITKVRDVARSFGGLATVGMLNVSPSSVNTVPGEVRLSLDIRHPSDKALDEMFKAIQDETHQIASAATAETSDERKHLTQITFDIKQDFASSAVKFHPEAVRCVEQSAVDLLGDETKIQRMTSGAGHDSVCTNMHCPTAMVFIPCKDGISHNPHEWCEKEDCATGANVLLHSVLRMDRLRKERGDFA